MNRRHFIIASGTALAAPAFSGEIATPRIGVPLFQEPLEYDFKALEPQIDAVTMEIHYTKYHAAHVANLRDAIASVNLEAATVNSLLKTVDSLLPQGDDVMLQLGKGTAKLPEAVKTAIRNHGGGHMNHTHFWRYMAPAQDGSAAPAGKLAEAIRAKFGSLDEFKRAFADAAMKLFGSGWVWLSYRSDAGLFISTTPNQDNPLMKGIVPDSEFGRPVLCLDLWEHAYYLRYQNRRADYIAAWWNVVNWPRVERRYVVVTTTTG